MSYRNSILSANINVANCNNKLKTKNVYFCKQTNRYHVQKMINGKHRHIRAFKNYNDAKVVAEKMNSYDLEDPEQLNLFIAWASNYVEAISRNDGL